MYAECQQEGVDAPDWTCTNSKNYTGFGIDENRELAFDKSCLNLKEKIKTKLKKILPTEGDDLINGISNVKLTKFQSINFWTAPSGIIYSSIMVSENFINKQIQENGKELNGLSDEFKVLKDGYPELRVDFEESED